MVKFLWGCIWVFAIFAILWVAFTPFRAFVRDNTLVITNLVRGTKTAVLPDSPDSLRRQSAANRKEADRLIKEAQNLDIQAESLATQIAAQDRAARRQPVVGDRLIVVVDNESDSGSTIYIDDGSTVQEIALPAGSQYNYQPGPVRGCTYGAYAQNKNGGVTGTAQTTYSGKVEVLHLVFPGKAVATHSEKGEGE